MSPRYIRRWFTWEPDVGRTCIEAYLECELWSGEVRVVGVYSHDGQLDKGRRVLNALNAMDPHERALARLIAEVAEDDERFTAQVWEDGKEVA